ncbi:very-long-chain (3R)-3-hydroxyacyl-CoA dehydratase 3-like [Plodia interpunctella]|uniref:very-long-chain (3R)-3-hydroxyacyl-CoA dehydratase 3-like n=1 Tax=Plodia interpunctella TaxID=58824 RepID=UPI002368759F|nr:very-long-chain (3R)-3-hydroxyacyl-CoA dehydratase 3-like [Plodia interpunctella]XP_053612965.1 very-long-chain (3R)-3-hydroxyacyl-CoA dehydratase 3-like [Plodia interpunctella]XP_053612966.1 very-long-chain (3R)-3-hydroxyacyl-CoA dehydratase 3-like [Plodia interpunctella]
MLIMLKNLQRRTHGTKPNIQERILIEAEKSRPNCLEGRLKLAYLVFFNVVQSFGFLYVLYLTAVHYSILGYASFAFTYDHLGFIVKLLHIMQILEIVHPIIGLTKGAPTVAFFQLLGRLFILFIMIDPEPRMQTKAIVPYLYVVWSTIEVIRHIYYISQLAEKEISLLTWLRYSAWIILYPMGIFGEATVMVKNIPYFRETMMFSITLPNTWNFSVDMILILRLQIFFLVCPVMYMLTNHMYKMRVKKMAQFRFKPFLVSKTLTS